MKSPAFFTLSVLSLLSIAACGEPAAAPGAGTAGSGGALTAAGTGGGAGVTSGSAGAPATVGGTSASGASTGGASVAGSAGASSAGSAGEPSAGSGGNGGAAGSGGSGGTAGGVNEPAPSLVPEQGALFGAYVAREGASSYGNITPAETQLGRKLRINHRFYRWADDWVGEAATDAVGGRVALVTWEAFAVTLDAIISGAEDALITTRANAAKALGTPIFMRWGHEMNGNWYPWGGANNGGSAGGPEKYIAAWRHIHDKFQAAGATNVLWVWCFNAGSSPNEAWNAPSAYYPGAEYVDWVAFDGYNWGTSQSWSSWRSFSSFATDAYNTSAAYDKPIMVPETGVTEQGGDKVAWIADLQSTLKSSFPKIKALVYFDTIDVPNNVDWRMTSSEGGLQAFVTLAKDPYFNP